MRSILTLLLFLTLASPVFASDGVLEINQTCAVQTGCFVGDTAGFPVTITNSTPARSFRLTSDLGPLPANLSAIDATEIGVTIDLGGFRIYGPVVCTEVPVTSCTPNATGIGVNVGPNSVVTNGTISGMGAAAQLSYSGRLSKVNGFSNVLGFTLGDEGIVEGNLATSNGSDGIRCGQNCIVRGNATTGNKFYGISISFGGIVSENTANSNGFSGINAGQAGTVSGNTTVSNRDCGTRVGTLSIVSGNTSSLNTDCGFAISDGSTVSDNTASGNGGWGIIGGVGASVQRNTLRGNLTGGLATNSPSTYRENTITENSGTQVFQGVNMGDNYCAGPGTLSPSCP